MYRMIVFLLAVGLLVNCCETTAPTPSASTLASSNFAGLCRGIASKHGGKITKEELLAEAKNKDEASVLGALYDMCDVEQKGYITTDELSRSRRLQDVIRLTTPGR